MKELTIEQKAQSYDEAIERAKQVCKTPYTAHWDVMKELIEHLFPELKEDEDDKIRKEIVSAINIYCSEYLSGTKIRNDMLAWLEKQGEPKDYNSIDPHFGKPADKGEPKLTDGFGQSNLRLSIAQIQAIEKYVKRYVKFVNS